VGVVAAQKISAPAGMRDVVRDAARRFKSSWVELGKLLVKVRDEALFTEWGHATFDAYCAKELHIRKGTADKLVRSFSFLSRHEPRVAEIDGAPERPAFAPAFEVVEVLAGAEARGQLSAEEYRSIRDAIWDPERPVAEVRRELGDRFPRPAPEPPAEDAQLRRLAGAARKLAAELKACRKIPARVADRAAALAEDVEEVAAQVRGG
jgi:hypothetical protein